MIQDKDAETVDAVMSPLDVLRRVGWIKDDEVDDDGRRCMIGAASVVWPRQWGDPRFTAFNDHVEAVISEQFPERWQPYDEGIRPAAYFNDLAETTLEDVELVLEKAQIRYLEQVAPRRTSIPGA